MEALRYADARALLEQLGPLGHDLVLIGGQAVNFWAESYAVRSSDLQIAAPFTRKDVDFCGTVQQAEECARRLHGRCRVFGPDQLTCRHAVVEYFDGANRERSVDFLRGPFGVDADEVRALSIVVQVRASEQPLLSRVMHPVHVLESRACNVSELPDYRTEKGLKQLRAAVVCARVRSGPARGGARSRRAAAQRARLCVRGPGNGSRRLGPGWYLGRRRARARSALPEAFERVRFPQMRNELEGRRRAAAERAYRSGTAALYTYEGDEFRQSRLVAKLRAADGTAHELDGYRPGNVSVQAGDIVRCREGALDLVARGPDRERSRGR